MVKPTIEILPGHHKRFLNGHPWLYSNEIVQHPDLKSLEPGEQVQVVFQNKPVGLGYYNGHSLLSFRCLSRNPTENIDVAFFQRLLVRAALQRETFYTTPYYRLIHAEADGLPGLIIDRFDAVFVLQINTQGMERLKDLLIEALTEIFKPKTIYIMNDTPARKIENLPIASPTILGEPISQLTVFENETEFSIDLKSGQKTGWFYDHRDNRKTIASLAKGKTLIDYYCYSGGFSIQAAKAGAHSTIGIDSSESALINARHSAELNKVIDRCHFLAKNVFEDMDERIAKSQTFEIVVLDPPAFVKVKKDLPTGLKGYEKLITKGIKLVSPNGLLLIASCSFHVKSDDLRLCFKRALNKNQRNGRIVKSLHAGFDHPLHPALEESEYLKGFLISID